MDTDSETLYFVTSNDIKYQIYIVLLGMPDLAWHPTVVLETKETNLTKLASSKVDYIQQRNILYPCFIEQSGLVIDSLKGLPGGLSTLFIDTLGDELVCKMLRAFDSTERRARIETIIYFLQDGKSQPISFGGTISGTIATEPRGEPCYGWDRIFIPEGHKETFAQMGIDQKLEILARLNPVTNFRRFLRSRFSQVGSYDRVKLRNGISTLFNLDELQTDVLFPLDLQLDGLEGETKNAKTVSLITYCERHGLVSQLINLCKTLRPNGAW